VDHRHFASNANLQPNDSSDSNKNVKKVARIGQKIECHQKKTEQGKLFVKTHPWVRPFLTALENSQPDESVPSSRLLKDSGLRGCVRDCDTRFNQSGRCKSEIVPVRHPNVQLAALQWSLYDGAGREIPKGTIATSGTSCADDPTRAHRRGRTHMR
jgi:hypothetical protein